MVIDDLKDVWNSIETWHKILFIVFLVSMLVVFTLVVLSIIEPVLILWVGLAMFFIYLIIKGKKGIKI